MADSAGYEAEHLLAQVGWVRQLARSLISDPDLADDVAQEAWLAALKSAPDRDRPLEPWLATVVRNFALRARRSASRRAAREEVAAKPEALPSASELYERAAVHKELVQAVLALDEPYKTTLLLRFLEELPPRTIAQRQGVPVRTVHTRLARGLAALRARLDREHEDDRGRWLTGLIALGGPPRGQVVAGSSVALATLAGILVVLAVGLTAWLAQRTGGAADSPNSAGSSVRGPGTLQASSPSPVALPAVSDVRTPVERKAAAPAAQPPAEQEPAAVVEGLVTDTDDRPIPGANVEAFEPDHARMARFDPPLQGAWHSVATARTDTAGRFRLPVADGRVFALDVAATGFARASVPGVRTGAPVHVRLEAGALLTGQVIDGRSGEPLEWAQVTARPQASAAGPGPALYTSEIPIFAFPDLPPGDVALEVVSLDRMLSARRTVALRAGEQRYEVIVVEIGATLRGRVVDRDGGTPIAGALVGDDPTLARRVPTDSDGRFAIAGFEAGARTTLYARAPGRSTASQVLPVVEDGLEVLFELERGRIARGRVLGPEGEPLGGAFVAAVADVWRGGVHESDRVTTTTRVDGTFALAGLRADLPHQLLVAKPGCASLSVDFPANESALELVELGDMRLGRPASIHGTLIGDDGTPLAGTAVYLLRLGDVGVRSQTADPSVFAAGRIWAEDATDSAGRFTFVDLPSGAYFVATSQRKLQAETDLREGEAREVRLAQ